MYDDFSETEAVLRKLKPKSPSEFCLARVELGMSESPSGLLRRWPVWGSGAAALLAMALVFAWDGRSSPSENTLVGAGLLPPESGSSRILSGVEPLEVRQASDGRFFRPYRMRYLNPQDDASEDGTEQAKLVSEEEMQFVPVEVI
mgnify:CR=1 FL=1